MTQPFITIGDRTSHGGTVISADPTADIHGKSIARVGDLTVCPRRGCRGIFAIISGADDVVGMGQPYARHGDRTACGAILLSSQAVTTWSDADREVDIGAQDSSPSLRETTTIAAPAPTICLDCLTKAAAAGTALVVRA